jgi:hypothetical protein
VAEGDLVFGARIDLLRRNLGVVEGVLTLIEERFRRGPSVPVGVPDELKRLSDQLLKIEGLIEDSADDETMEALGTARTLVRSVRRTLVPPTTSSSDHPDVLPEGHDLNDDVVRKAMESVTRLDELRTDIGVKSSAELWERYHQIEMDCQKLFYEYVDLVRGVALRSSGLDHDLCRIADELVRSVSRKWRSITIPSRLEKMQPTSGRIIRIGFPEWTVWNVPLAVHEYGYVFTEVVPELRHLRDPEQPDDRMRLESLMADAFAALTVGPAYGCAAVLTRLDAGAPARGEHMAEQVIQRASMIVAALEAGNPPEEAAGMVERLRDEWIAAVMGAGYDGDPLAAHPREQELMTEVNKQCIGLRLPYDHWSDFVATAAEKLRASSAPDAEPAKIERIADVDLRHLVNAAWLCRVPPSQVADRVVTDPDQLGRIAAQVGAIGLTWLPKATVSTMGRGQQAQEARAK